MKVELLYVSASVGDGLTLVLSEVMPLGDLPTGVFADLPPMEGARGTGAV